MKIGCDIIKIERIANILKEKEKIFTENEIAYCEDHIDSLVHYASLFSAKEAVIKALDIDANYKFSYNEVEINHRESGRPYVKFLGNASKYFKNIKVDISISNEHDYAIANAIVY